MGEIMLECCVDSFESARAAKEAGAKRLELCADLMIGGITPSPKLLEMIKIRLDIPVHVLIRPRFGDFLYTDDEFSLMKSGTWGRRRGVRMPYKRRTAGYETYGKPDAEDDGDVRHTEQGI